MIAISMPRHAGRGLLLVLAVSSTGCLVSKKDLETCQADAAQAAATAAAKEKDDAARIADLEQRLAAAEQATQDRDTKISDLTTASHNLQAQLDEQTAIDQQLRAALERLGKDADKLLAERGTLSKALDDAKTRLEELRKAQAAAEARAALFRDLQQRFRALIDAGQLRIDTRRGELVMSVTGDLLFEPGRVQVRDAGKGALMEIARALETGQGTPPGRRFLVTDHVDDAPTKSRHFKTAWDLTVARAAAVVEYLVSLGVRAETLTAAGAGSFDPLVPNDSAGDRAKNRRVEIALLPEPDGALVSVRSPSAPADASLPPQAAK